MASGALIGRVALLALTAALCRQPALASSYHDASIAPAPASAEEIRACLLSASRVNRVPPLLVVALLRVEAGHLGGVTLNTNDTVDIGPMQVNEIWLAQVATHWRAPIGPTFTALRDNFCANIEAGTWILRQALSETPDFWDGVARYHSHSPRFGHDYLVRLLGAFHALRATSSGRG